MTMVTQLASYAALDDLLVSLTKALVDKSVFKWKAPEDFDALYDSLVRLAGDDKLRVVATLGRVEAAIKKPVFDLTKASDLFTSSPELASLKDGDDRYYAALFIKRLSPEWFFQWAMINAWSEGSAEKVRLVFIEALLAMSPGFERLLDELGKAGLAYVKANEMSETKIVSRFFRVMKSLRIACQTNDIILDIGVGKAIDKFAGAPFSHFSGRQIKLNARQSLVPEIVELLLDLVGQRFSLAIEADHYAALRRVRKWCDDEAWLAISKKHPVMDKLSATIAEALLILARQNITDGELLKRLEDSVVGRQNFISQCQSIAASGHLDASVAAWLMAGGEHQPAKKTISSETEVAAKGDAADVGALLQGLREGRVAIGQIEAALDDLELFDPRLVPTIKNLVNQWTILDQVGEKIASRRSIRLVGELGRQVDIDHKLFDVVDETDINQRYGLVVRPAIVIVTNGKTKVIKKGVVRIEG
jgi:hypothetical protein